VSPTLVASVGHGSTALWYLTRATGLVTLVLLSATLVLGIVSSLGWTSERWPRFVSQALHRNLSLLCIVLVALHVVTTVVDGYVPIGLVDAFVPFLTPYRPLWIGLGALALDLLVAVAITSGLRRRLGRRAWRAVHFSAYLCWPIAVLHGLGSGSDTRVPVALVIEGSCVVAVLGATAWRIVAGSAPSTRWRAGAALVGAALAIGIAVFAVVGPLRPGWSKRAGTSPSVLTQLSGSGASQAASGHDTGLEAPRSGPP
jgi:DMSO/TMAO reductase YedYZ heme-binding membrane subunit